MSKNKLTVHICIWETGGNDPCVFLARTKKKLYEKVWDVIQDYWEEEVGEDEQPPTDPSKALDVYIEACRNSENGEYFTFCTETVD